MLSLCNDNVLVRFDETPMHDRRCIVLDLGAALRLEADNGSTGLIDQYDSFYEMLLDKYCGSAVDFFQWLNDQHNVAIFASDSDVQLIYTLFVSALSSHHGVSADGFIAAFKERMDDLYDDFNASEDLIGMTMMSVHYGPVNFKSLPLDVGLYLHSLGVTHPSLCNELRQLIGKTYRAQIASLLSTVLPVKLIEANPIFIGSLLLLPESQVPNLPTPEFIKWFMDFLENDRHMMLSLFAPDDSRRMIGYPQWDALEMEAFRVASLLIPCEGDRPEDELKLLTDLRNWFFFRFEESAIDQFLYNPGSFIRHYLRPNYIKYNKFLLPDSMTNEFYYPTLIFAKI